jgi:membrane protein YdbS with pleckstrin-like domain
LFVATSREFDGALFCIFQERSRPFQNRSETLSDSPTPTEKIRDAMNPDASLDEQEVTLWEGKYSGRNMAGIWIMVGCATILLLLLVLLISPLRSSGWAWTTLLILLLIGWLIPLALMFYRIWDNYYVVTNQRLKHRDGIIVRTNNRIELIDIDDVMFRQGPIQAALNVGNIIVRSSDVSHPELVIRGIADVRKVSDLIDDARRAERRRRGLHIEAI